MEEQPLFLFRDYREYIRRKAKGNKHIRGYLSRLAQAAGCQRSYLSQVLNSHIQLTLDHAAGLCEFWKFDHDQTEYFVSLVGLSRAASRKLMDFYEARLMTIRKKYEEISSRLPSAERLPSEYETLYYSSWHYAAIHVIVSIPAFTTAKAIANKLHLPLSMVENALTILEKMNLVKETGDRWRVIKSDMHLPVGSLLTGVHHSNWRQKTILHLQQNRGAQGVHYTGVHTLSRSDANHIKQLILEMIAQSRKIITPSKEEAIVAFQCDYFEL